MKWNGSRGFFSGVDALTRTPTKIAWFTRTSNAWWRSARVSVRSSPFSIAPSKQPSRTRYGPFVDSPKKGRTKTFYAPDGPPATIQYNTILYFHIPLLQHILPHHYVIRRSREIASASSAFNAWLAPLEEGCLYVRTNCNSLILRRTTVR